MFNDVDNIVDIIIIYIYTRIFIIEISIDSRIKLISKGQKGPGQILIDEIWYQKGLYS